MAAIAAELFDFTHDRRSTALRAYDYATEAFETPEDCADEQWSAVAQAICRCVELSGDEVHR